MDEPNLTAAFELLDALLTIEKQPPVWLVVGGGSSLLIQKLSVRQTKDVDVMALREWEGNLLSAYPLPETVKQTALKVAKEFKLDSNWLNGSASLHFFDLTILPPGFWLDLDTREYGKSLKISFIRRNGMLLLKLYAALNRDQRRDLEDLISINPSTAELEENLLWILENIFERQSHSKLLTVLTELGHADLIRRFQ